MGRGLLSELAAFRFDEAGLKQDSLRTKWLEEHQRKLLNLRSTLEEINDRFQKLGDNIDERIQSEQYLSVVRKAFRAWDQADTDEKRRFIANLITNAAGTRICSDDILRLFLDWLETYHETHFAVIKEIYKNPGSTRYDIWSEIYGDLPREDSAEADLYKMLVTDLSIGHVIRQERDVNQLGQFIRRRSARVRRGVGPQTFKSAFDDTEHYVLTELGKQFVHYTMNEVVSRLADPQAAVHNSET